MAKSFQKKKTGPNATGPKYRTPDHFKGSKFSGGGSKFDNQGNINPKNQSKFNPGQFKVQHKG